MFRILKTIQTNKFLRSNVTRPFAHYCDSGEYHFLDKLNYVGNHGVYWTHPQSSFIIRVTDDYDQCLQGNHRCSDDNTCWLYFPKKIRTMLENDFSEQDVCDIEREIQNWKLIQKIPKNTIDFYAGTGARCYGWFSNLSAEQKVFGGKQYIATFYTDDAIEKLNSDRQFNAAADEFLNNLGLVYSEKSDQVTDLRKFKGRDNIPDIYIERAIEAIEIQKELVQLGKRLLKPKNYDSFLLGCCHYLSGVTAEKVLFQQHCPTKTIISGNEGKFARHRSIGFKWILPTMMTDEATSIHLNNQNPAVDFATFHAIFDNDIAGYFKDKYVEFSPMTHFASNSTGQSDLNTVRILADRTNEMKKMIVYIWENVPPENAKHYEYLAKYVGFLTDFNFVLGLRRANYRYGWIPKQD